VIAASTFTIGKKIDMKLKNAIKKATQIWQAQADKCSYMNGINNGYCEEWAAEVITLVDENIPCLGFWIDGDSRVTDDEAMEIAHCALWCDGKWYDSDIPNGVDDPMKLLTSYKKSFINKIVKRGPPPNMEPIWDYCKNSVLPCGRIV